MFVEYLNLDFCAWQGTECVIEIFYVREFICVYFDEESDDDECLETLKYNPYYWELLIATEI